MKSQPKSSRTAGPAGSRSADPRSDGSTAARRAKPRARGGQPGKRRKEHRPWTDEEAGVLRNWAAAGWNARAIAEQLQRDRNSVIGKAFREGIELAK